MKTPKEIISKVNLILGKSGKIAFLSAFVIGLLTHMSMLVSDIPNHDGLASMYFDQNMITSGRWFLGISCGISSFYLLPWLSGLLSIIYLSVTCILLVKLLKIENPVFIVLASGMLVTFPTIASNFAYVFTMDGYMVGLMLAVLAVLLVETGKLGFLFGAVALAFSMGIYQSYLPVAILLSLYKAVMVCFESETVKNKSKKILNYLYMGAIGVALYYVILRVLLVIQGKELDTYQGINGMASGGLNILASVKAMYSDFVAFTLKGNIIFANGFALAAVLILAIAVLAALAWRVLRGKLYKSWAFYIIGLAVVILVPIFTNVILVISPDVTYHILMRYQWTLFGVMAIAFIEDTIGKADSNGSKLMISIEWAAVLAAFVIVFSYSITDNIAYSNLEKKYEKTYSYCLRLADRIETTEGYYEGIPIYMIGVVGDDNYPSTDITGEVTGHMLGIPGDYLLYTSENYEQFYKYYMGITFNFLAPSEANYYDSPEYVEMPSFPGQGSTKVVDGVMYVKTENMH